jgi:serine/threonine protein phosphatase 1
MRAPSVQQSRTLAIGDIHGQFVALRALLDFARVSEADQVLFLGDYVDGNAQSAQVLDFLSEFAHSPRVVALRGNHDLMLAEVIESAEAFSAWMYMTCASP